MTQKIETVIETIQESSLSHIDNMNVQVKGRTLTLGELSVSDIKKNFAMLIIAKRASGKSWIIKDLICRSTKEDSKVFIISPTDRLCTFYSSFVIGEVHYDYKPEIMKSFLEQQKITKEKVFVVLDDCISTREFSRDVYLRDLICNGKYYNISLIISMQYVVKIDESIKHNFDYVCLLADDNISSQKKIYDIHGGIFPKFDLFKQVFVPVTMDYGSLILSNQSSSLFSDKVKFYKAPQNSDFKINAVKFNQVVDKTETDKQKVIGLIERIVSSNERALELLSKFK